MTVTKRVVVGSRSSPLSLAQTDEVLALLKASHPDLEISVMPLSTGGDRNKIAPLLSMERGMFVREIELALLHGEIDIAVHSAKDLPALLPEGLEISAFTKRNDPRDVLVNKWSKTLMDVPSDARIGTSSPRRISQLKAVRPDLQFLPIRGNVGTRLEKARGSDYDGVILAAAGIKRLSRESEIVEYLDPSICTPDVGQGALALESRTGDESTRALMAAIDDYVTSTCVKAERAFLQAMGGGCTVPVAAYATYEHGELHITAMVSTPDGGEIIRLNKSYSADEPAKAGVSIAEELNSKGAKRILEAGGKA